MRLFFSSNVIHRALMKGSMPAPKNELASSFSMPPHLHYKVHHLRHKPLYLQMVHTQTWNRCRGKTLGWFQPMNQWTENKLGLRQLCPKFLFQYLLKNLSPFFRVCAPQVSPLPSPAPHSSIISSSGQAEPPWNTPYSPRGPLEADTLIQGEEPIPPWKEIFHSFSFLVYVLILSFS